jgi:aspartyl-tRNA(Asn)/glutamyl-tRNA(Gln) amidotransferase subunit B
VKAYAVALRAILRYLGVNSGDMEKGILRFEPNISVRPFGSAELRTRTELKNLNSFRALERGAAYEIERQIGVWESGGQVMQETRGWDEAKGETVGQRGKEHAHDYRYFPEPDLSPLVITPEFVERVRAALPELPAARRARFQSQYGLSAYDAAVLTEDKAVADYFEAAVSGQRSAISNRKSVANWITGELFRLMNASGQTIEQVKVTPGDLAALVELVSSSAVNANTAKAVFAEMFATGRDAPTIVAEQGLAQVSDNAAVEQAVADVLAANPEQVATYLGGKATVEQWFFGQVMKGLKGRGNPQVIRGVLASKLASLKESTERRE